MGIINNVTMLAIILAGAAVVREREHGTMDHLLVMPLTPFEIAMSKVWANGLVITVAVGLSLYLVVRLLLGIPIAGSIPLFMVGVVIYLFFACAIGIFLATVARSMPQLGLLFMLVFLPMNMLSGSNTPLESMPPWLATVMQASPSTHFVSFAQSILYRGAGFDVVWPQFLLVAVIGGLFFFLRCFAFAPAPRRRHRRDGIRQSITMKLKTLPLSKVYQLLEPGPVVLLTTARRKRANVMAMSWHMMIEFEPPQIACVVSNANYSFAALQSTGECVIAIPARKLAHKMVKVGNSDGPRHRQIRRIRPDRGAGAVRGATAGRRLLRQSRMQGDRPAPGHALQPLHSRSAQSLGRSGAEESEDPSSSRLRHVCRRRRDDQVEFSNAMIRPAGSRLGGG